MTEFDGLTLERWETVRRLDDIREERTLARLAAFVRRALEDVGEDFIEEMAEELELDDIEVAYDTVDDFRPEHLCEPITFAAIDCDEEYGILDISNDAGTTYQLLVTRAGNPMGVVHRDDDKEPLLNVYDGVVGGFPPPKEHRALCQALQALEAHAEPGETVADLKTRGALDPGTFDALLERPASPLLVYRLTELPDWLRGDLPTDNPLEGVPFWIEASKGESSATLGEAIPEGDFDAEWIERGLELTKRVTAALSESPKLAELLQPREHDESVMRFGGAYRGGFHTEPAGRCLEWLRDNEIPLVELSEVLDDVAPLEVRRSDGSPPQALQIRSLSLNQERTEGRDLEPFGPDGVYLLSRSDPTNDLIELFDDDERATLILGEVPEEGQEVELSP